MVLVHVDGEELSVVSQLYYPVKCDANVPSEPVCVFVPPLLDDCEVYDAFVSPVLMGVVLLLNLVCEEILILFFSVAKLLALFTCGEVSTVTLLDLHIFLFLFLIIPRCSN